MLFLKYKLKCFYVRLSLLGESVEVIMCGRFMLISSSADIAERLCVEQTMELDRRYNIAPAQEIIGIALSGKNFLREMRWFRWGLVPFWAKDTSVGSKLLNARSETLAQKPAFRNAFKNRRLLIPTNGFYEWDKSAGERIPFLVGMKDDSLFAMAGIWEQWTGPENHVLESCSIITTNSNELVGRIHDRMPVIVRPENYPDWVAQGPLPQNLASTMLKSFPAELMRMREVSPRLNRTDYDKPDCIVGVGDDQINWTDGV